MSPSEWWRYEYCWWRVLDRKSTRLNSSHVRISYAVFCLKKKNHCHRFICPVHDRHSFELTSYSFLHCTLSYRHLHSFPTRRSSDLTALSLAISSASALEGDAEAGKQAAVTCVACHQANGGGMNIAGGES